MAIIPPTYTPSGSLSGTTTTTTPYTYGNLGNNTSAYNIWGSTGNPYLIAGPAYTPGSGSPVIPRPVAPYPVAPTPNPGVNDYSDYVDEGSPPPMTQEDMNFWGLNNFGFGANQLDSGLDGLNNPQNSSGSLLGTGFQFRDLIPGAGFAHLMNYALGPAHPEAVVDNPVGIQQNSNYNWNTASPNTSSVIAERQDPVSNAGGGIDNDFGVVPTLVDPYVGNQPTTTPSSLDRFGSGATDEEASGGSYIATAATQALGEDGLTIFEEWRDYMFDALPTFTTSYGRYRVTAPKIVAEIDKQDNSKDLYREIWDKHLKPIYKLIKEDKDNPKALSDYKVMVKALMNKYLKGDK
jgi:hypothetical protein